MYVVKNNLRHPATIFENTVFILDVILFGSFTVVSFFSNAYVPAAGFTAFLSGGLLLLYENNAPVAYVYDNKVIIRKFLKKYTYQLDQVESVTYTVHQRQYDLVFSGKKFSVPDYYLEVKRFVNTLKTVHNYFATEEGIEKLKNYIKEKAGTETYLLIPRKDIESTLTSSKIGGVPYWDISKEYPVDSEGKKMHLLCQLNFSECKFENMIFPKEGILQFFISSDDVAYGMSYYEPAAQKNWRIVFHEKIDKNIHEEDIQKIIPSSSEIINTPILHSTALEFLRSVSYMSADDYKMNDFIAKAVKEITGENTEKNIYEVLGSQEENIHAFQIYRMLGETENYILGYPSFIQGDVRETMSEKDASYYDTTLLHLDSSCCNGEAMCWGDVGAANFLINSNALKNRDFSNVLYTWDCY